MNAARLSQIADSYSRLRVVVVGDFCLDRYLEIDPRLAETSIETGLPVYNVTSVRPQPGAAGTILNNLAALNIGNIYPVGFAGDDGEGYELIRGLSSSPGVRMDLFVQSKERRTFTYCKPLMVRPGEPPKELNRLDSKNWTQTPASLEAELKERIRQGFALADCVIVLDQVDKADTGVVTRAVLDEIGKLQASRPDLLVLADSRRGLRGFPPLTFKMNGAELRALLGESGASDIQAISQSATRLAELNQRQVFVTLSEQGILGASPCGQIDHVPVIPVRGEIDVVGAGDAVSANLAGALASGATVPEALLLANAAASVVIHKLGTTGTASVAEIRGVLGM